jgi:hypothetical protein
LCFLSAVLCTVSPFHPLYALSPLRLLAWAARDVVLGTHAMLCLARTQCCALLDSHSLSTIHLSVHLPRASPSRPFQEAANHEAEAGRPWCAHTTSCRCCRSVQWPEECDAKSLTFQEFRQHHAWPGGSFAAQQTCQGSSQPRHTHSRRTHHNRSGTQHTEPADFRPRTPSHHLRRQQSATAFRRSYSFFHHLICVQYVYLSSFLSLLSLLHVAFTRVFRFVVSFLLPRCVCMCVYVCVEWTCVVTVRSECTH